MPLKHATETFLVLFLAVAIALTGLLVSTLPALPEGGLPWGVLIVLAVIYPLSLTRVFRNNRADYAFRWLHWFPALIVLFWMILQIGVYFSSGTAILTEMFTWGWTLPAVVVGIVLVAVFCLHVIRRRVPRIFLLLVVLVPFVVLAVTSESAYEWDRQIASVLWQGEWWTRFQEGIAGTGTGVEVAMKEPERNLEESQDKAEEAWRERLRAFERRRQMIAVQLAEDGEGAGGPQETPAPATGTGREYTEVTTPPLRLPSSGAGAELLGLMLLMAYCGVLHSRARRRVL